MTFTLPSPPWTKGGKTIESMMRKALYTYEMLPAAPKQKVAIGLSGGKDSLTLLFMLHALSGRGLPPLELYAIHIQGTFSCGASLQQEWVEGICRELSIPCLIRHAEQARETLSCYSCSRLRRRLLFDGTKEVGASLLALGHHREDNAQTLLMNLLHKGECAGMLPSLHMVDFGVTLLRPLILVPEALIRDFARHYGFARALCRCPVGQNSMRKRVDTLLTEVEALFPHARSNLSQASLCYGSEKARLPRKVRNFEENPLPLPQSAKDYPDGQDALPLTPQAVCEDGYRFVHGQNIHALSGLRQRGAIQGRVHPQEEDR